MSQIVQFKGTRYYDTWFHAGDLIAVPYDAADKTAFSKKARSVIQNDCHVHGILHHGYKVAFEMADKIRVRGADDALIAVMRDESAKRLRWLYNFIKRDSDPDFDLENTSAIRELVSRVWSDEFIRVD